MRTWKKPLALLLSVMMLITILPTSVIGTESEEVTEPIVDVVPLPEEAGEESVVPDPEPADTAPEAEPQEYSNDADILPDGGGKSDIFAKLTNRGYLYLSTSGKEFTVYADSKREAEECRVVKDGFSVLYVDGRDGDMIHVRFTDQFGKEHRDDKRDADNCCHRDRNALDQHHFDKIGNRKRQSAKKRHPRFLPHDAEDILKIDLV